MVVRNENESFWGLGWNIILFDQTLHNNVLRLHHYLEMAAASMSGHACMSSTILTDK